MANKENKDIRAAKEGEGVFSYLLRTTSSDILQAKLKKAEEDQIKNYRFSEGKQSIIISLPPRVVRDDKRFSYTSGIGYIGAIKEMRNGKVGDIEFPIVYTEVQFWELVGQVEVHFPLWTASADPELDVLQDIKLIATTQKYFDKDDTENKNPKTKTRFEIDESYEGYKERNTWLENKIGEVGKKEDAVVQGKVTEEIFGRTSASAAEST